MQPHPRGKFVLQKEPRDAKERKSNGSAESGMGLPHSTTLARNSGVPLRPRGRGVRQPHAALFRSLAGGLSNGHDPPPYVGGY